MSVSELKADVAELRNLLEQASRPKVKDVLSLAIRRIETDIINTQEESKKAESASEEPKKEEVKKPAAPRRYTKDITTYGWDQSDKFMKIYVTVKGVQNLSKEGVTSEFTDSSFSVKAENVDGVDYRCAVGFLWEDIDPSASYVKIKTDTLLVMLRKVKEKSTWAYVTKKDKRAKEKEKQEKEMQKNKDDPEAGMMNLMKKMYDEGDDEMKRTIAKAWTESQDKRAKGDEL